MSASNAGDLGRRASAVRPGRTEPSGLRTGVARWAEDLLRVVLPPGCVACGVWLPGSGADPLTCPTCRSRLRPAPWPRCPRCHHPTGTGRRAEAVCRECSEWPDALARARWAYVLEPPADALAHGLKYGGWSALAHEMGRAMVEALGPDPGDVVVPVPTTPERERSRGYNQAALLAEVVAASVRRPLAYALLRTRGGATQVALSPSMRRANVKGVFGPRDGVRPRVRGARVVLVDDVLTTGSTAGAAASELIRMGAREVTVGAFARALPFRRRPAGRSASPSG